MTGKEYRRFFTHPGVWLAIGYSTVFLLFFFLSFKTLDFRLGPLLLSAFVFASSTILILQGLFSLAWMLYAWQHPDTIKENQSPTPYLPPQYSFTALLPARHEVAVIGQTIRAIHAITYPEELKETLVICRADDTATIAEARRTIADIGSDTIKVVVFSDGPVNKPQALNVGLAQATHDIVTIFDAEDQVHGDIYDVINTVLQRWPADVIQAGVQLMNCMSRWYSPMNVLEYFFWFKSGLLFFTNIGKITPLGGNTAFFRREVLQHIGGWDANCLTEDADVGFRLSAAGARIRVVYDERHVTQEECPLFVPGFLRQRTRWVQGFLQVFLKRDWFRLATWRQRIFALYILLSPIMQNVLLLLLPLYIWIALTWDLPVIVALYANIPLYLFLLQMLVYSIGMYEFTQVYGRRFPWWLPLQIVVTFFPYQLLLALASVRAITRLVWRKNGWEKTEHTNAHRAVPETSPLVSLPLISE